MHKDVFISYSSKDADAAFNICHLMERYDISCWIAPRDVGPGQYAEQILNGIESSDVLLLVLSENANMSAHVRNEVERAVSKGKAIFTIRIRNVIPSRSLELFISSINWIDAWTPPIHQKIEQMAKAIKALSNFFPPIPSPTPNGPEPVTTTPNTVFEGSFNVKVESILEKIKGLPFAAAAYSTEIRSLVEMIESDKVDKNCLHKSSAIAYRLYAGSILMSPEGSQPTSIRSALPWLQKAMELFPSFIDRIELKEANKYFTDLLLEHKKNTILDEFIQHQMRIVMVEAKQADVDSATKQAMTTISEMLGNKFSRT
jgi:hypothetical protein